jgi:hypothetical protein
MDLAGRRRCEERRRTGGAPTRPATSNGVARDIDPDSISKSIGSVYEHAELVGSLVLPENDSRAADRVAKGSARMVPLATV